MEEKLAKLPELTIVAVEPNGVEIGPEDIGFASLLGAGQRARVWFSIVVAEHFIVLLRKALDEAHRRRQQHGYPPMKGMPAPEMRLEGFQVIAATDGTIGLTLHLPAGRSISTELDRQTATTLGQQIQTAVRALQGPDQSDRAH